MSEAYNENSGRGFNCKDGEPDPYIIIILTQL